MSKENDVNKRIQMALTKMGSRLFRNNTGTGWVGKIVSHTQTRIIIDNPRPLVSGLVRGGSDLIGWTPVTITPEMVGKTLAVFTAIEVKTGRQTASTYQKKFISNVLKNGGFSGVAKTESEAENIVKTDIWTT